MSSNHRRSATGPVGTPVRSMDELEETAADWIARRNGGGLSADEQARLNAWLAADPRHAQAFDEMESSWTMLNEPRRIGRADVVWTEMETSARRRKVYAFATAGLAAAAALMLAFLPLYHLRPAAAIAVPSVAVRPDLRTLPDGSTVELNVGAEIALVFTPEKRGVRLLRGEALFAVAKDATRPFVVTAGAVEVRAVGTEFTVRHESRHINVLVTEGRVAVERIEAATPSGAAAPVKVESVYLEVGRQAVVPTDFFEAAPLQIKAVSADELAAALAWRDKRIEFTDTPLADAVTLFNRQNRIQLSITHQSLVRRLITGVFWADDPEGFVRLLEKGFNIKAERSGDVIRLESE